uniref:Uncharacterized protein n=1 Tax=Molossus molossus TaxID=27622 RepID=A0A7J8HJ22_MOLMO|nr:hypothetical protein HJG59_011044 [Molossus molossus]
MVPDCSGKFCYNLKNWADDCSPNRMEHLGATGSRGNISWSCLCFWILSMLCLAHPAPIQAPVCKWSTPAARIRLAGGVASYKFPASPFTYATVVPVECLQHYLPGSDQAGPPTCVWDNKLYMMGKLGGTIGYQSLKCQAYGPLGRQVYWSTFNMDHSPNFRVHCIQTGHGQNTGPPSV